MKTDREQLQEIMARYALAIDSRDYDGLGDCFAIDARADYNGAIFEGRDAILALMRRMLDPLDVTQHLFTNLIIDMEADVADIRAGVIAQHVRYAAPGEGDKYQGGGRYNVEVRRADGVWRISRVEARRIWAQGNPAVMSHAH